MKKTNSSCKSRRGLSGITAGLLLAAAAANAQVIFEADFSGSGNGTGGNSNLVTTGGTGAIVADGVNMLAYVTNAVPFSSGSSNYLEMQKLTTSGGGSYFGSTFTFASGTNSWTAWQGSDVLGVDVNGNTNWFTTLNGAFDCFFRVDSAGGPNDMSCLRMVDMTTGSGGGQDGLAVLLTGETFGDNVLQIENPGYAAAYATNPSTPPAIQNITLISGSADTLGAGLDGITLFDTVFHNANGALTTGQVYHVAFSFSTDTNGLITMNIYEAAGAGAISPVANLAGSVSFNIVASNLLAAGGVPTDTAFVDQPWNFSPGWADSSLFVADYASTRLYGSAPASFPGLPAAAVSFPTNLVLEMDFLGSGHGTGGTSNLVTYGATAVFGPNAGSQGAIYITNSPPFTPAGGNFMRSISTNGVGTTQLHLCNITPVGNLSWDAMVGPPVVVTNDIGVITNLVLNGGYDMFFRPTQVTGGTNFGFFLPVATASANTLGDFSFIFNVPNSAQPQNIFWSIKDNYTAGPNSFASPGTQEPNTGAPATNGLWNTKEPSFSVGVSNCFVQGQATHYAFTLNTDTNGLITLRFFISTNVTSPIITSSTNNLICTDTFYGNGAELSTLDQGLWQLIESAYAFAAGTTNIWDYSTLRIYSSDPGVFPGLAAGPEFLPPVVSGGRITLSWTNGGPNGGRLLWSTNLFGPWTTNMGATSPYSEAITSPSRFYQLLLY